MYLLCTLLTLLPAADDSDSLKVYQTAPVTVSASLKHNETLQEQPVAAASFSGADFTPGRIVEPKDLSLAVPNMMYADYGSEMTSSIYIRGIGSRIDQPAMGLYIDNIPILNKNNYDLDYFDLQSIDVLRGPQSTLFGRNTIGGLMNVQTLSPLYYQGTRVTAGYGNGNTSSATVSTYQKPRPNFAYSLSASHRYTDGFFTNAYDGSAADRALSENIRLKLQARPTSGLSIENVLSAGYVKQTGFAYGLYDEQRGEIMPVDHNDPCDYHRFGLTEGLVFRYTLDGVLLSSATSYQYMDDRMVLDQDFLPESLFTLEQAQREHAFTQEFVARSSGGDRWQWTSGLFGFYKHTDMDAPVTFKKDGIDQLILAGANAGIHTIFPNADLLISEEMFPIASDFTLPAWGVSLYHQSSYSAGRWKFVAGLRADYERTAIRYENSAQFHYRFTMTMPDYKALPVTLDGRRNRSFFEVVPKAAVMFETGIGNLYASVSKGYKAGGYNTQIFSYIVQSHMMSAMMADVMASLGRPGGASGTGYDASKAISYKPEHSWNYEVGAHFSLLRGQLFIEPALFWIDCRNQQLTVFPPGKSTGRMMSNAGRSRSLGAELSVGYRFRGLNLDLAYGHTNAEFREYDDGNGDYSGKKVPYAPANTVSIAGRYGWDIGRDWADRIEFGVTWQGAGRIYWNESNTISQPFYGLLSATVSVQKGGLTAGLWGRNLTDTEYSTFYFSSIGNSFMQRGKPLQAGIFIRLDLEHGKNR